MPQCFRCRPPVCDVHSIFPSAASENPLGELPTHALRNGICDDGRIVQSVPRSSSVKLLAGRSSNTSPKCAIRLARDFRRFRDGAAQQAVRAMWRVSRRCRRERSNRNNANQSRHCTRSRAKSPSGSDARRVQPAFPRRAGASDRSSPRTAADSTQIPCWPSTPRAVSPKSGGGANHHFFELLDVPAHVAAMLAPDRGSDSRRSVPGRDK